jgi:hypothetical protein
VGKLAPDLLGLELARVEEQLPGAQGHAGRFEVRAEIIERVL